MRSRAFFDPLGWLSAVLLLLLERGFGIVSALVVPRLIDLLDESPRLAMFGFLCLIVSPGFVAGCLHRATHRTMDGFDRAGSGTSASGRVSSTWAGAFAWLVLFGTNLLSMFVMLVLVPPRPNDAHLTLLSTLGAAVLGTSAGERTLNVLHAAIWIAVAALLFGLERASRRR